MYIVYEGSAISAREEQLFVPPVDLQSTML